MKMNLRRYLLILLVAPGCGGPTSPESTPPPGRWTGAERIGGTPEAVPNCNITQSPRVGMDAGGGAMAAWLSECAIWTARYLPGQGWTQPQAIGGLPPGAAGNWLWEPTLAVSDSGSALVVWATQQNVTEGRQLWARSWQSTSGWAPAERIDGLQARKLEPEYLSAIAMDPGGNGLAVWASQGIVAARFDAGRGWMDPERIGAAAAFFDYRAVSLDSFGRALATWVDSGTAVVQRFEPDRGWSPPTRFGPEGEWTFEGPGRVAFEKTGRAVLVWTRSLGYRRPSAVWSAVFSNEVWTPLGQVSDVDASGARVGLDEEGRGLGVWNGLNGPSFARFDFRRGWGPTQPVISAVGAEAEDLAVNASGDAFIIWRQRSRSLGDEQVRASRYVNGQWEAAQPLEPTSNGTGRAAIAVDPRGNAIAVWAEYEPGRVRVWANRFDTGSR
jgi:hypothetical protein